MALVGTLGSVFFQPAVPGAAVGAVSAQFRYPHPWPGGRQVKQVNKVWDTVAGAEVSWSTIGPDSEGGSYPGPGVFGVTTSNYRVQSYAIIDIENP